VRMRQAMPLVSLVAVAIIIATGIETYSAAKSPLPNRTRRRVTHALLVGLVGATFLPKASWSFLSKRERTRRRRKKRSPRKHRPNAQHFPFNGRADFYLNHKSHVIHYMSSPSSFMEFNRAHLTPISNDELPTWSWEDTTTPQPSPPPVPRLNSPTGVKVIASDAVIGMPRFKQTLDRWEGVGIQYVHVRLNRSSIMFEQAAIDVLRRGQEQHDTLDAACRLLVNAINHDLRFKRSAYGQPSTRLYDLLAGLAVRYHLPEYTLEIEQILDKAEMTKVFAGRLERWSNRSGAWYRRWSDRDRPIKWGDLVLS
jgi:hypothetical protein